MDKSLLSERDICTKFITRAIVAAGWDELTQIRALLPNDRKAAHLMSAFAHDDQIILAHLAIDEKSNEIPAVQDMIATLGRELGGLSGRLFTVDAMHAQKNIRGGVGNGQSSGRPAQEEPANPV